MNLRDTILALQAHVLKCVTELKSIEGLAIREADKGVLLLDVNGEYTRSGISDGNGDYAYIRFRDNEQIGFSEPNFQLQSCTDLTIYNLPLRMVTVTQGCDKEEIITKLAASFSSFRHSDKAVVSSEIQPIQAEIDPLSVYRAETGIDAGGENFNPALEFTSFDFDLSITVNHACCGGYVAKGQTTITVTDCNGVDHEVPACISFDVRDISGFNCGTAGDPVTVDVNGTEVQAEAGETVTVNVTRNGAPIGDVTVTGLTVDVDIPICDPCEDVTVTLNGDEVATVEAGNPLELTTTLNGVLHPATYSAGTINLVATIPTQSGIVYRRQTPTQGDIYEPNDTGTKFQAGFYNPANVPYPVSFARLDPTDPSRSTLLDNNKHGNKERFTLPSGAVPDGLYNVAATHSGGAISVYVVEDHYLGCCWVGWNTTAAFTANLTLIASLNVTGIGTGLAPLCDGGVQDIQVANGAAVSNLLVDNGFIAATYWTGLTSPVTTTQGYRMQTVSQGISVQSKSSANRGIAFKFF